MKVLARINRVLDAGGLAPRTGLYTQLRKTPFTASAVTGTEIATGLYEFDVTGTNLIEYLKCYVSTDNSTFEEYKSWGGTDGIRQKEYLSYSVLLNQTGENAPVPTILENTVGTITWERDSTGTYYASISGGFDITKTAYSMSPLTDIDNGTYTRLGLTADVANYKILIVNFDGGVAADGQLSYTPFEIRIYP